MYWGGCLRKVDGNGTISAVFAPITRKVTIEAGEGGSLSITVDGKAVASGSSLIQGSELNIMATPGTGYSLDGLTLSEQFDFSIERFRHCIRRSIVVEV